MNYRNAGVDISKGDRVVVRIKRMMGASGAAIGHFGGWVPLPASYREPLLVSSIDSVGTKTMVASAVKRYRGIGSDIVHHCINDVACCGAEPIAFLDYIAMGSLDVEAATQIVRGVIQACERWNVALIGGETAEMPDVYAAGEFDLVGAIHGIVERDELIDGSNISAGDVVIGFPSDGLHTNGFSLARKVFAATGYDEYAAEIGSTVGDALLAVHRCYLAEIRELRSTWGVRGLAHITGGGIEANISRVIPEGLKAVIDWGAWGEPPLFGLLRQRGNIPEDDLRRTFNLGVGLAAVVPADAAPGILTDFNPQLTTPFHIGEIVRI